MNDERRLIVQFPWKLRGRLKENKDPKESKNNNESRSTIYRKKIKKENPTKYEAQKKTERERWHRRKQNPSTLSVEEKRRKWAAQKRKQRASASQGSTEHHHSSTRKKLREMSQEEKREYWRISRQKSRKERSIQKERSDRMKDRNRKREAKEGKQCVSDEPDHHRAESADVSLLEDSLHVKIQETKNCMNDQNRRCYYDLASVAKQGGLSYRKAEALGISRHVFNRVSRGGRMIRKKRCDTLPTVTRDKVISFWLNASREYPCKKRVKGNRSIFVLTSTYTSVFRDFRCQHPQIKIGFIRFLQLRPNNVRKLKAADRNVCCCPKCENAKYVVEALNQVYRKHNLRNMQLKGVKDLADVSVCPYTKYPAPECLRNNCDCCVNSTRSYFQPLMDLAAQDQSNTTNGKLCIKKSRFEMGKVERKRK